ncbi:MAG: hypothetical protein A2007_05595 [Verrucomicrobia bacterium GWC2_42_7]|nr:MAG: hypothetical protein A2007_05595 [Verrucomicrobia bacterium GWC2_42_7]
MKTTFRLIRLIYWICLIKSPNSLIVKLRKPFFSREKKGFRAFQRKAIVAEIKSIDFISAKRGGFFAIQMPNLLNPT